MKFLERNYPTVVAGLISVVGLMGYAPVLRAETDLLPLGDNYLQSTLEIVESPHEVNLLPLAGNNEAKKIRPPLKNLDSLNDKGLLPSVEQQQSETFPLTFATASESQQQQELPSVEQWQSETLPSTFETANATHQHPELPSPEPSHKETGQSPLETAPDAAQQQWPSPVEDNQIYQFLLIDQLEYRHHDTLNWDAQGWVGSDYRRLWIKTEGEVALTEDGETEAEIQVLYSQLIAPFWDFQVGLRYDKIDSPEGDHGRAFAVVGVQGLTPYQFEVDAALFISENGDVSARFAAEYELLLTQRLILQPEFEANLALQQVEEFGVGTGLNDIELGLRLRYEISRQFAPYIGISWIHKFGGAADFARQEGESIDNFGVVGGVRLLF